jgi:NAD(P)-dependent dehydrogenase (short-subunit alcohol dehydrogenase family)
LKTLDLSAEAVCVTGSAGAIGAAVARELGAAGAKILVTDVVPQVVEALVDQLRSEKVEAIGAVVDVTDENSIQGALRSAHEQWGFLSGLVNCAGILRTGPIEDMPLSHWDDILAVNVTGTYLSTRAIVPHLKRRGSGAIVNISSVSAFIGSPDGFAYTTTKGAVLSFTYGTAGELASSKIRVNAVCPGWVSGGFTQQAMDSAEDPQALVDMAARLHLLGRMATPVDVANAVVWLMSPLASFVTGTALFVDGGFMAKRGEG